MVGNHRLHPTIAGICKTINLAQVQTSVSIALPRGEGGLGKETKFCSCMKIAELSVAAVHFTT